jgi:hypothetical protein
LKEYRISALKGQHATAQGAALGFGWMTCAITLPTNANTIGE